MLRSLFLLLSVISSIISVNSEHQQLIENGSSLQKNSSRIFSNKLEPPLNEFRQFHEFLENQLARKILEFTLNPLTKPGDNYNSILRALEVTSIKNNRTNEVT